MEKQVLGRRQFLMLASAAGSGALLAACAPATPQVIEKIVKETVVVQGTPEVVEKIVKETVQVEKEKVVEKEVTPTAVPGQVPTVRYLTDWYGGARGMLVSQILGWWAEEKGDVANVAYEPCPSVGDRLRIEFASGTAPDAFLWSFTDTPELKSWLGDMSPFYERDAAELQPDDIIKNHPIFYQDGIYCLPMQGLYHGAYINVDLFTQAGAKMPWEHDHNGDKWWNWDDWREAAVEIRKLGDDIYGFDTMTLPTTGAWMWIWTNGGDYIDPEKKVSTFALNEAAYEAMVWMQEIMCKSGVAIPNQDFAGMSESLGVSPAAAGKVGIAGRMEEGAWKAAKLNGQRVVRARSPNTGYGYAIHNHQPNCIWKDTPYMDEAWQIEMLFASARAQLAIGLNGTSQPCRYSVAHAPEYLPDIPPTAKEALFECLEGSQWAKYRFYWIFKGYNEWAREWADHMDIIWNCEGDLRQVVEEMDTALTEIIQRSNPNPEDLIY